MSLRPTAQWVWSILPGTWLVSMVAMSATLVSTLFGGPQLLYALFFGVALHYLSAADKFKAGIDFCSRHVLRLGVGLLGVRITADQIIGLGWITAAIVVGAVVTTLLLGYAMAKRLGLSRSEGTLSGGAVAICGASAALAIAAVLPRSKDSERFTLMVVVTVTVFSTIAMVLYPFIARAWGLSPELAGLFLGGTIHDVAQVVGAGYTLDTATGDYATIVKLLRVSMLAVLVIAVSCFFKVERDRSAQEWEAASGSGFVSQQPLVPWFLWVFLLLVFVNSAGWLSSEATQTLNVISRVCLVVAIAALGLKTSLEQLSKAGWQPITLILIETVWIAAFVLVAIALTQFA